MALKNIDELNPMHVDVLTELGNIGTGNAATALSQLTGIEININVPKVRTMDFNGVADFVGGPENVVMGVLIKIDGDINGMILYILDNDFIENIMDIFFHKKYNGFSQLDEMELSTFSEIGNIMACSYVNALSSMTGMFINVSPPAINIDMAGAILSVPLIEFARVGDKVLFIDDSFGIGSVTERIKSNMILVPEMDSLNKLFKMLGVE